MTHRIAASCIALAVLCSTAYGQQEPAASEAKKPVAAKSPEAVAKTPKAAEKPFKDEPAAHALYKQMIKAMRKADALSYVSHFAMEGKGFKIGSTYRAWLKKPNYFRVEAESDLAGKTPLPPGAGGGRGVLIGDGNLLWIYWPKGRYKHEWEDAKEFAKIHLTSYIKKGAPPGGHSIGHEVCCLGAGMSMPVIDPSTFHGYTDSLQKYLDGVRGLGAEKVARRRLRQDRSQHYEAPAKLVSLAVEARPPAAEDARDRAGEFRSDHHRRLVVGDRQRGDSRQDVRLAAAQGLDAI